MESARLSAAHGDDPFQEPLTSDFLLNFQPLSLNKVGSHLNGSLAAAWHTLSTRARLDVVIERAGFQRGFSATYTKRDRRPSLAIRPVTARNSFCSSYTESPS